MVWNNPARCLDKFKRYKGILSPAFSMYTELPQALQIYSVFKNRWVGAYFQKHGVNVIPTMQWGEPQSYWYCFDGIEKGSTVAISTLGVKTEKALFTQGYKEMLRRINPKKIICYCEPFEEMDGNIEVVDYAKTNNLGKKDYEYEDRDKEIGYRIFKYNCGYVVRQGMGHANDQNEKDIDPKSIAYPTKTTYQSVLFKLFTYLLNKKHKKDPTKAIWLERALGFTIKHIKELASQIKFSIKEARETENTPWGQKYEQKNNNNWKKRQNNRNIVCLD